MKPIQETIDALMHVAQKKLPDGTKAHKIFLLSNQDSETFAIIKQKYASVFKHFDGIMISGDAKMTKPDPEIFKLLLTTYNLVPTDCFFIDDQEENLVTAEKLGIQSILIVS